MCGETTTSRQRQGHVLCVHRDGLVTGDDTQRHPSSPHLPSPFRASRRGAPNGVCRHEVGPSEWESDLMSPPPLIISQPPNQACPFPYRDLVPLHPNPSQAVDPLPFETQLGEGPDDRLFESAKVPVDVLPVPPQVHDRVHDDLYCVSSVSRWVRHKGGAERAVWKMAGTPGGSREAGGELYATDACWRGGEITGKCPGWWCYRRVRKAQELT